MRQQRLIVLLGVLLGGCGDEDNGGGDALDSPAPEADADTDADTDTDTDTDEEARRLLLPSKGGAIAINEDGDTIAVANLASDSVSFLSFADPSTVLSTVDVGDEPVSVTWGPDNTVYVVNRASQTVSIVEDANTEDAAVATTLQVGSEPGMAALLPSGTRLYVPNWADSTLSVIDTVAAEVDKTITLGDGDAAPYAVCISNDGDEEDTDELIFITDFYSRPVSGGADAVEANDRGRQARVFRLDASGAVNETWIPAFDVVTGQADIDATNTGAFPNQLYSCVVNKDAVYVTAVAASPEPFGTTTDFHQNVHGMILTLSAEDGRFLPDRSVNLNTLIAGQTGERRFAAVPQDIAFVPERDFGYVAVRSANMVFRVDFSTDPPSGGAPNQNFLAVGRSPSGLAISGTTAYAYNEVGRSITAIDLSNQTPGQEFSSAPLPAPGSEEAFVLEGQRFFDTGLARWSTGAWVSCVSCHPLGTTDNVTWVFPAGPRQTVDTSATFDENASCADPDSSACVRRILNWTAIFDEIHDFELNTRGVAGGVGAIVTAPGLDVANRIDFVGPGGVGNPENGFNVGSVKGTNDEFGVLEDWDEIEAYIASLRSPRGRSADPQADVDAGRALFAEGGCQNCHGGSLWTISQRYFTPLRNGDLRERTFAEEGVVGIGLVRPDLVPRFAAAPIADHPIIANDPNGAPQNHGCVLRDVGTFDAVGAAGRGAPEIRQNGNDAQGVDGFNVPSLLNMVTGAPYLHNGAAETLEALFTDSAFQDHTRSGNLVFQPTEAEARQLAAFVRSIDPTTPIFEVPNGQIICPPSATPPLGE